MMSNEKRDKDFFAQALTDVKPIKKSNKNYKKVEPAKVFEKKSIFKKSIIINNPDQLLNKTEVKKNKNFEIGVYELNKKIKKGKIPINKKVDLHGLTVEQARIRFYKVIDECFYSNKRCILFVTGKGLRKESYNTKNTKLYHGKIRNFFLQWIYEKENVAKILSVSPAGLLQGGDGAFFIYLRKNKN